ncbi:MAG: hypothetical protein OXF66_06025 [Gammaproteobacteria bacterium]|nr:hypothetical protein [Gammaproteobacteria bacterium]
MKALGIIAVVLAVIGFCVPVAGSFRLIPYIILLLLTIIGLIVGRKKGLA